MLERDQGSSVAVLTTGGTIDKRCGEGVGVTDLHVGTPYAPARYRQIVGGRVAFYEVPLMAIDSLKMTGEDRAEIATVCRKVPETAIIITHGTDTMVATAEVLHAADIGKTIIITGALLPAVMKETDADFNLGAALAAALFAPSGVYIAMNGVASWNKVTKDPRSGRFVFRDK